LIRPSGGRERVDLEQSATTAPGVHAVTALGWRIAALPTPVGLAVPFLAKNFTA
jgi:hypothetical protein